MIGLAIYGSYMEGYICWDYGGKGTFQSIAHTAYRAPCVRHLSDTFWNKAGIASISKRIVRLQLSGTALILYLIYCPLSYS
jgi:hypothetical protein